VKSGEGDEVDGELSEIGVELSGESEGRGDSGHDSSDYARKMKAKVSSNGA
jgi:hypothetical protein